LEEHYQKNCASKTSDTNCKKLRDQIDSIVRTPADERAFPHACKLYHKDILKKKEMPKCVDARKQFKQLKDTIDEGDKPFLCPDHLAKYNCRAEGTGTKGDTYRFSKDDRDMEKMCSAKVDRYLSECNNP